MSQGTFNPDTKVWTNTSNEYRYPLDMYYGEKLLEALSKTPDRILQIIHEESSSQTCEEIKISSIRVAQNLQRLGIQPDNVIGFICNISKSLLSLIYGCVLIGAPINSLHTSFTKEKIQEMFEQTKPVLVFCDSDFFHVTRDALKEISSNAIIYTLHRKIPVVPHVNELLLPTGSEYHYKPLKFNKKASDKLIAIMCSTDATNEKSKGVCMPHTAVLTYAESNCRPMKEFRSLNFSPTYTAVGIIGILLAPFRPGETRISTISNFSPELCVMLIEKYQVSVVVISSAYLNALVDSPLAQTGEFSSIVMFSCSGSLVTGNLYEKFKQVFPNKPLLASHGSTEVIIAGIFRGEDSNGLKVGRTYTNIQVKIVSEDGNVLDIGEIGEIFAKPEFRFLGYYNSTESSEETTDCDGFIKTGDMGYIDKNGFIFILDKNSYMFKYKNTLITPMEIEKVILSVQGVESVIVVGIPDAKAMNLTAAVVVKKPGYKSLSEHDILSVVAEKLPHTKYLYGGCYFIEQMPLIPDVNGLRQAMKEIAATKFKSRFST